jgi:hypothetical protein
MIIPRNTHAVEILRKQGDERRVKSEGHLGGRVI